MKKKSLGQHFLTNPEIAEKIVSFLNPGKLCVEIGAGEGILTEQLIKVFERVVVIEKDWDLIPFLEDKLNGSCKIIHGDVLKEGEEIFNQFESFKVASNLPYNISTPITFMLLKFFSKIPEMVLMYQKEVADKISKETSLLSCAVFPFYTVKEVMTLKPGAFSPPPKVNSSVLHFERNKEIPSINPDRYFRFLKVAFQNRRKILFKRLLGMVDEKNLNCLYSVIGLKKDVRIDGMSREQVFKLYLEVYGEKA